MRLVGQAREQAVKRHTVVQRVVTRGLHRGRVDVHSVDGLGAHQRRTDGQDAAAAAVVQHALPLQPCRVRGQPAQAHARGRVGASAKGQAGVQADDLLRGGRCLVPTGHDPESGRDFHRRKLRLRQPHPVLIGQRVQRLHMGTIATVPCQHQRGRLFGSTFRLKQGFQCRAFPARRRCGHARFTKQRVFGIGVGIGVFHTDGQAFHLVHQQVGQCFHHRGRGAQNKFDHAALPPPRPCAEPASPGQCVSPSASMPPGPLGPKTVRSNCFSSPHGSPGG